MSFQVGETVGRYRIVEQLGQGGMATVLKAYHAELDRYVAIKVLHPAFLEDTSFLARFQREARVVAKLDHPNIVPIYDYSEHEGRPYLVMKFIEGETLKARLTRAPLTQEEVQGIVEAVGAALGYAHKQGILHRDIKPSNVLLTNDGQIYLADFGLARIAQSGESTITSDMIIGTPQYISPEQALGKKNLDEGTDIYSLGVMLYELTVGKVPFSADTPFSIIHDHIYSPLPLPRAVNPAVSEEVERVLLKALSKERADRHKDVKSLVAAFQQAWAASPTVLLPPEQVETVQMAADAPTLPPAAMPDQPASVEPTVPVAAAVSGSGEKPKKPRKFPWMWLALAVILLFGCLFVLWAVRTARPFRPTPTQAIIVNTLAPLQTPVKFVDVRQAMQAVEENPDDPNARMQLAMAYHQAEMPEREQEAISEVVRLAASDETFLWDAARLAAGQEAWLSAARLSVAAAMLHLETNPFLPDDVNTLLHESVYKAMKDQLAATYITSEQLGTFDEPLSLLAKARYTFFDGDQAQAQQTLDELMQLKPGLPEGQLLQAEFSSRTGEVDRARLALAELRANPGVQDWMLQEAEIIEGTLP
ncbi:MAG: tetratricopeptide repeat protein [Chloroflexota bacterium]